MALFNSAQLAHAPLDRMYRSSTPHVVNLNVINTPVTGQKRDDSRPECYYGGVENPVPLMSGKQRLGETDRLSWPTVVSEVV